MNTLSRIGVYGPFVDPPTMQSPNRSTGLKGFRFTSKGEHWKRLEAERNEKTFDVALR